jgi:hypothetical protein
MSNAIDLASSFAVKHCNGYRESGFATYDDALKVVKEVYKGAVIGHDGDITDGGVTTLCWEDETANRQMVMTSCYDLRSDAMNTDD